MSQPSACASTCCRPGVAQKVDPVLGGDLLDFTGMTLDPERGEVSIGVRQ
jgi:hypothetical protein